jgi:outer membrane protein assembly factor BamB
MVFIGSDDGRLYALDEKTGNPTWTYKTGSNVKSTPAVANGRLYVGSEDGYVYCFGPGTGILPQPSYPSQSLDKPYTIAASVIIAVAVIGSYLYVRLRKRGKKAGT